MRYGRVTADHPALAMKKRAVNPFRILAISFLLLIGVGTLLLMAPFSSREGMTTTFIDALFTAASCVSVTGLASVDTYMHWSLTGQIIMVLLIQIGGMGTMTFSSILFLLFRRKIGLKNRLLIQEDTGSDTYSIVSLVKRIAALTLGIELVGGIIYSIQLYPYLGSSAVYYGFCQGVSTFCNAGFVFFDNVLPYQMVGDWLFTLNTCFLILLGGFGYMSIYDVVEQFRPGFHRLSLHTKIILYGQGMLIIGGFIAILGLEWTNPDTIGMFTVGDKIQAALFQAITPRTAGLATLDYSVLHPITVFVTIILMFIGAGPNSTGGGIKITTIAVIWAMACSIFTNKTRVELFERTLTPTLIYKAGGIVFFSTLLILLGTFILAWNEDFSFLDLLFEVTSAFSTVGLSRGITMNLTDVSKLTLVFVMFTGRIGVLTLIGAFALQIKPASPIAYPEENVML